jgi:CubicO group peptidase (beta-lactamase class C family)
MKNRLMRALIAVAGLAVACLPGTASAQASLDGLLKPYLADYSLPALAAAVAKGGKIVAAGAVGVRRAGADIPVTLDDRFHLGSDTKAMTALLAAMLVEEGRLSWSSTPAEVFPALAPGLDKGFAAVTLERILSHSAGLPSDSAEVGEVWGQALDQDGNLDAMRLFVVREWGKRPLAYPAGQGFAYSNLGYVIAGAMIERAAGKTWDELIVERLFTPLGLTTAGLGCQASPGRVDAPLGHVLADGKAAPFLAGPNCDNPSLIGPAGIAHMSILDFARWASWNAGQGRRPPALVRPETLRRLHTPLAAIAPAKDAKPGAPTIKGGYGLGWGLVEVDFAPQPLLHHTGSNNKNLAAVWVDVENDLAIVLAANIGGEKADAALKSLAERLYRTYSAL